VQRREPAREPPEADAAVTFEPAVVLAVLSADCLPVVVAHAGGERIGIAHAGWRGLAAGVIERMVAALAAPAEQLTAWLGPAIGPAAFEVGAEVRAAFVAADAGAASAFAANARGRWQADLYLLARRRLERLGVAEVAGGGACTYTESERFFSFRRDSACGRMATLAWIEPPR
jgi:polyphenol oxidase